MADGYAGGVGPSSAGAAPMPEDQWEPAVPDFDPSAQSGYITSGELMAWLAVVGGNTYDDMRRQMVGTEQRRELQKDLTSLKATIEETELTKDVAKLEQAMNELIAKYEGTPLEARLNEALGAHHPEVRRVSEAEAQALAKALAEAKDPAPPTQTNLRGGNQNHNQAVLQQKQLEEKKEEVLEKLDSWITHIQGVIDALGTEDQLALIRIQELNSQVTQATQLASNILAAQDQAASTAIMNLKV